MLEIKNLNVSFKTQNVLNNLNLNIEEGIVIGILGKNGAGKTTLFESLYQNVKYSGAIKWHNESLKGKIYLIWKPRTTSIRTLPEKNTLAIFLKIKSQNTNC